MIFVEWLDEELNRRNWTRSELSRKAGVSTAALSLIYSGKRQPGHDLCINLSRALDIPQIIVLEKAGLLSTPEEQSEIITTTLYNLGFLPVEDQEEILEIIKLKRAINERRSKYTP
jgi:transcriptional regulator with XRE-family HTH domain